MSIVFVVANKRANSDVDSVVGSKYFTDCTVDIQHQFGNTVTEHPVEDGVSFSDHVQVNNNRFTLNGVFSDIPLTSYGGDTLPIQERITAAYKFLKGLRDNRTSFSLVSKYETYPDCVVESLTIPVGSDNSASLFFSLSIVQIRKAKVDTVYALLTNRVRADKVDSASSTSSDGKKNTKDAPSVGKTFKEWLIDLRNGNTEEQLNEKKIKEIEEALSKQGGGK